MNAVNFSSKSRIVKSLLAWRFRVLGAHVAAIVLGLTAALMGIIIGPAFQVLTNIDQNSILWKDLVGPVWAAYLEVYSGQSGVSPQKLLYVLPTILLVVAGVKALLTFLQWYTWEWLGEHVAYQWRRDLVHAFAHLSPERREDQDFQDAESRLSGLVAQDIRTCRDFVVHYYGGLPREGLQCLFMAFSLVTLSPKLFLIFMLCILPIVGVLSRIGKKLRKRAGQALEENSLLGEWIQQRLLGIETIKHFRSESVEIDSMKVFSHKLYERFFRLAKMKAKTSPFIESMGVTAMAVALYIAFAEISAGRVSGAVAMSFFSSLALFAQSGGKLGKYFNSNREGLAAADRIYDAITKFQSAHSGSIQSEYVISESSRTTMRLRNISIKYGEKLVVENFNYDFGGGKIYTLVGESGAGKSTIFNVILGLRRASSGTIEFEVDQKFKDRTLDFVYMPQHVTAIPVSVMEAISYPFMNPDHSKAKAALDKVGFPLELLYQDKQLETELGAGGMQLSGGQLQRVQLARMVYHHAPFILVDEGTSALDPEVEQLVMSQLRLLAQAGAIIVMIAHRMAAVELSDEIIVLEDGKIAAHGDRARVVNTREFKRVFK